MNNDIRLADDESRQKYEEMVEERRSEGNGNDTDLYIQDDEKLQTPIDPFDKLALNPGRSDKKRVNPVCPDCGEPIRPWANQHERRFICGCDELKEFVFEPRNDDGK